MLLPRRLGASGAFAAEAQAPQVAPWPPPLPPHRAPHPGGLLSDSLAPPSPVRASPPALLRPRPQAGTANWALGLSSPGPAVWRGHPSEARVPAADVPRGSAPSPGTRSLTQAWPHPRLPPGPGKTSARCWGFPAWSAPGTGKA